ncbi:hypothetical protein C482_09707 [Natrialba chahannaoensis JCM 10990]|uniref:Uncharacterized protein n=2 Tax=Natrialba chahannaoensis TaxID=68911 RepID=M0AN38_9EURY|nr:hypothetical protein C482_09707 [Natrialba chahannaoensis JCM 10990]
MTHQLVHEPADLLFRESIWVEFLLGLAGIHVIVLAPQFVHFDVVGVSAAAGFDFIGDVRDELLRSSEESTIRTPSDRRLVRRLRCVIHLEGRILVFVTEVRFERL